MLLVGAPGTGKTLLARAVAGEAGVPFFSMSAAEFVEMIVGVGAARVRDLFKQAREHAPAIIFIDELDAIGRARGQVAIGGSSEQEQTLNQILTEMDGFSSREGIIVLAATNQPDVLDKALLRPGRFDRRVVVNLPDKAGREAILKVHTRNVPLASDVDLAELAAATPGLSGADLQEPGQRGGAAGGAPRAGRGARRRTSSTRSRRSCSGPSAPLLLSRDDRERIAYHEGGHAILGLVVPGADPVHRVTIVPRGQALGVTYQRPDSDRYNYPEAYLRARIVGMLGGRAAEEIVYGTTHHGRRERHRAGDRAGAQHGHALGHERRARHGAARAAREPVPRRRRRRSAATKPFSEETARVDRRRGAADHQREPRRGDAAARASTASSSTRWSQALLARETLDEQEILEVTGLPPAPPLPSGITAAPREGAAS